MKTIFGIAAIALATGIAAANAQNAGMNPNMGMPRKGIGMGYPVSRRTGPATQREERPYRGHTRHRGDARHRRDTRHRGHTRPADVEHLSNGAQPNTGN